MISPQHQCRHGGRSGQPAGGFLPIRAAGNDVQGWTAKATGQVPWRPGCVGVTIPRKNSLERVGASSRRRDPQPTRPRRMLGARFGGQRNRSLPFGVGVNAPPVSEIPARGWR